MKSFYSYSQNELLVPIWPSRNGLNKKFQIQTFSPELLKIFLLHLFHIIILWTKSNFSVQCDMGHESFSVLQLLRYILTSFARGQQASGLLEIPIPARKRIFLLKLSKPLIFFNWNTYDVISQLKIFRESDSSFLNQYELVLQ